MCINCKTNESTYYSKFCNVKCSRDHKKKVNLQKWLSGEDSGTRKHSPAFFIKPYLISTRGNRCSLCKWAEKNPVTQKVPIELDHIDGDWTNNKIENLRLLCPNCHSLTPTYRALNRRTVKRSARGVRRSGPGGRT